MEQIIDIDIKKKLKKMKVENVYKYTNISVLFSVQILSKTDLDITKCLSRGPY